MTPFAFIAPETVRNLILIVGGIAYLAYHVIRLIHSRKPPIDGGTQSVTADIRPIAADNPPVKAPQSQPQPQLQSKPQLKPQPKNQPQPSTSTSTSISTSTSSSLPGEDIFRRARAMRHQAIPDYRIDGLYLDLLGESAALGYAPALEKLGEYAMRRGALVEAYYWMWQAQKCGAADCAVQLRRICREWTRRGRPDEVDNVYELFSAQANRIGRALLGVATGYNAGECRRYLRERHPEFL